ncbi:MAG: FAD-dependent oxidoreductase [Pseudonocardiaceae bacterium]
MRSTPMHVIVIGAGTGGLCLAQGLRKAGISVAVYERDGTRTDGLLGYRVGISPDGNRALRDCLPPTLFETYVATTATTPSWMVILTEQFSEILSQNLDDVHGGESVKDPANREFSVSRMTLRQVLLTGIEDAVQFDKVFSHYEQCEDGSITAFFEDGTSATGHVLVAADGSHSRVRTQYLPQARLLDSGLIGVTGKVPMTTETRALLPEKSQHGISMIFAPHGYFCILHVMTFPWGQDGTPRNGIGGNDATLLSRWPGLLYDNSRDYIMWGFSAAARYLPADVMHMKGGELQQLVRDRTPNWHPNIRELFRLADPDAVFPINIRTSEPLPQWPAGNVTLIGDAIHTMTPGRGVGANMALRDARLLCHNLTKVRDGKLDLLTAVHNYETRMVDYGFDAVLQSRKQMSGDSLMHKPVLGRLALAGMRTSMRVINRIPAIKRRMAMQDEAYRGLDRDED